MSPTTDAPPISSHLTQVASERVLVGNATASTTLKNSSIGNCLKMTRPIVDLTNLILMPAPQTPISPTSSGPRSAGFGERTSSKLGPPPEVLEKYKLKPKTNDIYNETYLCHPKVAAKVFKITHSWPNWTPRLSFSMISFNSGDSTETSGHITMEVSQDAADESESPTLPPSSRNPFGTWLHILAYVFHPNNGYEILQFPLTGVLIVRNNMRLESDKARWEKQVELFVMRCYTEDHARRKLQEWKKCDEYEESVVEVENRKPCPDHPYLSPDFSHSDVWLDYRHSRDFTHKQICQAGNLHSHPSPFDPDMGLYDDIFEPGDCWMERYLHALRTGYGWDDRDGERSPAANIFGATAVGRQVRFAKLVGGEKSFLGVSSHLVDVSFKGRRYDLMKQNVWDIEANCGEIEEILTYIDDAHWI